METTLIRLNNDTVAKLKELNIGSMNDTVSFLLNPSNREGPKQVVPVSQDIDKIIEDKILELKKLLDNTLGDRIDELTRCIEKNIIAGRMLR